MLPLTELFVSPTDAAPANNRWGDYFSLELDDDAQRFWGFASYLEADGYFNTKIIRFRID